jgi:hypothetical protein
MKLRVTFADSVLEFDVESDFGNPKSGSGVVRLAGKSKVKTLAAIDVEKVQSIEEFVERTVTQNRLMQGIDKFAEMQLAVEPKNTSQFIKWVIDDVFKEELDTLLASGLTPKDVSNKMAAKARNFFLPKV